jgi:probable F420-dependent oxidoreductase
LALSWRSAEALKFGLFGLHRAPKTDPAGISRLAASAEEAGFESLWVGDHIALPRDLGEVAEQPRFEALMTLSFLAAATKELRLGAGVIVLPQRQPVLLAKQLSSLDVLSGGRLIIGIGVGYVDGELKALGVDRRERATRTDEYLRAIRTLWSGSAASFHGRFVSFSEVVQRPRPVQMPHPPLVIGGNSLAAYARAVRVGNGWYGWDLDPEETAAAIRGMQQIAEDDPRTPDLGELEFTVTPNLEVDFDIARRYSECGVHRLVVRLEGDDEDAMRRFIVESGNLIGRL